MPQSDATAYASAAPRDNAAEDGITLRCLATHAEYDACVALQLETWGAGFTELVPPTMLRIAQKLGGVAAGAFAPDGTVLGFVFGLTGVMKGKLVHWSDMLAVRPEARDRGLGQRLKHFQRELVRPLGVETILWTFDPLVARNAHLNLNRLGARVCEYVPDMYGTHTNSALHSELGTDRFIVAWDIAGGGMAEEPARASTLPADIEAAPIVNAPLEPGGFPSAGALPDAVVVRVEIPGDLQDVLARSRDLALRWRETTRRAFLWYLARGYAVSAFGRDTASDRRFYVLTAATDSSRPTCSA